MQTKHIFAAVCPDALLTTRCSTLIAFTGKLIGPACCIPWQKYPANSFPRIHSPRLFCKLIDGRTPAPRTFAIEPSHSVLSACIGSMEAARRAGMNPATIAQIARIKIAPKNATGS